MRAENLKTCSRHALASNTLKLLKVLSRETLDYLSLAMADG